MGAQHATISPSPVTTAKTIPASSNHRSARALNSRRKVFPRRANPTSSAPKALPVVDGLEGTGHGTSPLVRQRLDAFLKEYGDKGQSSPDHIRFLTYTTRYNRSYWVSLDGLEKHYERAEVDARRSDGGARTYDIKTKNLTRLVLRETGNAREIRIDGQTLKVKAGSGDHARP